MTGRTGARMAFRAGSPAADLQLCLSGGGLIICNPG